MRLKISSSIILMILLLTLPQSLSAAPAANVTNNEASLHFPDSLTFHADIESAAPITSVVLEYGTDELTCGTVVAKAFPEFTPAASVSAEWTWEMKQSGSLPPGGQIWWRWRYLDETGQETVSEEKTILWLDGLHPWRTLAQDQIRLHYYNGDASFGGELLEAAVAGLARVEMDAGLKTDRPVDLYVYANTNDLQEAVLYEPGWTGGLAFPDHDVVIIGIPPDQVDWGKRTIRHELTHVLVGHLTFSCLGFVPTWLNEGLAVYAEGALDPASQKQLDTAIHEDTLLSVHALSGSLAESPDKAYLSYSESFSIVKFLIEEYGRDQMTALLIALRDGNTVDAALTGTYGFDVGLLEDAWRASIGARARTVPAQPTSQPTATHVPTIAPIAGLPMAVTPTPFPYPTLPPPIATGSAPPVSLTLVLIGIGCILGLILGVVGLGVILTRKKRKADGNEETS